jgi:hypothetical protein
MQATRLLYHLTRQDFDAGQAAAVVALCAQAPVDWEAALALAREHHVAPLVYRNLAGLPVGELKVPPGVLGGFKRSQVDNLLLNKDARQALEQALALFGAQGLEVMLVKGSALNLLVYDQPWYTLSWDIDLVTRLPRQAIPPAARQAIETAFAVRNQAEQRYTTKVEYDFYSHHDVTMNGLLPVDMSAVWRAARPVRLGAGQAWVMGAEDLLITAAISACRKRYFKLKNLCDLAEITHRLPGLDWQAVAARACAYRCSAIVYAALRVTCLTLGGQVPAEVFPRLAVPPPQAALIDRLARLGAERVPLQQLSSLSQPALAGRRLSWPLLLTYASYRPQQAVRKISAIIFSDRSA